MSKQVVVSATVGRGKYTATYDLTEEQVLGLAKQGLLRLNQGKPSGMAEKALAYPNGKREDMGVVVDEVTGKERPWARKDIPFSPEFEKEFTKAYEGVEIVEEEDEEGKPLKKSKVNLVDITWEPYEGAAAPEPKFARAKQTLGFYLFNEDKSVKALKSGEPRTAASFAVSREIPLPTEPWEEDLEFLKAVTDWLKEEDKKKASGD